MSHAVQFYHDDVFLIDAVAAFIRAGYEEHATLIVVATKQHRKELRTFFQASDQAEIEATGMYIDTVELLSAFMVKWPARSSSIHFSPHADPSTGRS
ncbi:MAG: MEDS domain-containing protein [Nitrospirales bacterium]